MLHSRLMVEQPGYLDDHFSTCARDRPLIAQLCGNSPATVLAAARLVEARGVDAVDLNLGCPQGIAKRGRYGAFLLDEPDTIVAIVRALAEGLRVPVTCKIRVLAILSANRVKRWPQIPTVKEQGYDVNASSSYGIGGPKGMDPKIVKLLHDTFRKGLDDPEFLKLLDRYDTVRSYMNTEDYTRWAREQYAVEKAVVEKFGLKP